MQWITARVVLIALLVLAASHSSVVFATGGPGTIRDTLSRAHNGPHLSAHAQLAPAALDQATLVRTINLSQFSPPIPDPTGIVYLPSSRTFLISDSEVDETPLFEGNNIFFVNLAGTLVGLGSTTRFSREPTALAVNPKDGHLFVSDDNPTNVRVTEINPGPDQLYFTGDDRRRFIDTRTFGSSDPEGLAFATEQQHLFVLEDTNQRLYEISPGTNGIYEGQTDESDDFVTSYSLSHLGLSQIKGVAYYPENGHLYLVGGLPSFLVETTITGKLVRKIDISAMGAIALSDLAFAPSSLDAQKLNLYVTDRGVDNNVDPNENDGRLFEIALPAVTPSSNKPPDVNAGQNITVSVTAGSVALDATVTDDGLPSPPGELTVAWSQLQGPSALSFSNPAAVDTTIHFTVVGRYVLRLLADDGDFAVSDTVTVVVVPEGVNAPPTVDAGPDQRVAVGQTVTLVGTVTDDGLPDPPGAVTTVWSTLSGPQEAVVAEPSALTTQVHVPQAGEYVLRLTANDGELETHDTVTIIVSEEVFLPLAHK